MHDSHSLKPWWRRGALLAAATVLAAATQAGCSPPAPTPYQWQRVMQRLPSGLLSVWGTSERDVYVVGGDSRDGNGPMALRYDGTQWRRMDTGVSSGDLWWVYGVAPEAVYMVGASGLIIRYNPRANTFERMAAPSATPTLFGVWGANASDVWAVGGSVVPGDSTAVIWHYDGASWQNVPLPATATGSTLFKVWGTAANDVWAIGQNSSTLHWDGSAWSEVTVTDDQRARMLTVHGNGRLRVAVGGTGSGTLLESDPSNALGWRRVTLDGVPSLNGVFVPPEGQGNPVAVGVQGTVLHRNAQGQWRTVSHAPAFDQDYHAVWIDPTGAVWAVGGQIASVPSTDGMIYHFGVPVPEAPMVMDPSLRNCPTDRGSICTWAGAGSEPGFNGDGRHRRDTVLYWPVDMEFSPTGQPFVLDWQNHRIRRVNADETFETVVGTEIPGDGDVPMADLMAPGAAGTDVALNHPTDLIFGADGQLIICAWHNHKIRRWDPATGRVVVMAGRGPGLAGDGAMLSADTRLKQPSRITFDAMGNMYVLDQGNLRVRRIGADGMVSTVAGSTPPTRGFAGDGGPALMAQFSFQVGENPEPEGAVAVTPDGARLFIADSGNHRIRVVDMATGVINTLAGTGQAGFAGETGPAAMAQLSSPRDIEIGPDGNLWIADTGNHCIRRIDLTTNTIRTMAGTCGQYAYVGDRGPALQARLQRPFGIAFDREGNLYISDTFNNRIRRVVRDW